MTIRQPGQLHYSLTPATRIKKRQDALKHQYQAECDADFLPHVSNTNATDAKKPGFSPAAKW